MNHPAPGGRPGPLAPPRRAAVLGKPIAHSLSPVIHNAGLAAAGLAGWEYTAIECDEPELAALVAGLGRQWTALSLTMPLKEVALRVADSVDPRAAALGAANTLVRVETGWHARNSDAPGMVDALRAAGAPAAGARVAVLGGGGTARAALGAAAELGAAVTVYARRAAALETLRPVAAALGVPITGVDWSRVRDCVSADVIISTVPRGAADDLSSAVWRPGSIFFDVVYDPWPTRAAAAAAGAGVLVVSGLELLLAQAVRQFEWYTRVSAPVAAMRQALAEASNAAAGAMWTR